ncbi:MAG: 4Fe-4S dicluster domain-containing protein [Promethearchaeota archaeon]|jgi:dissimilatory sulfite reductase (desulfoviridin) alpha/beta subunit
MTSSENNKIEDLKKSGYILQKDSEHFTVRLRIPGGDLSATQIVNIGKIALEYGKGKLHLTTRQGIQIPWIKFENLIEITRKLEENGTPPGSCGPRIRNISSCVGLPRCPNANIDTLTLSRKIDEHFFDVELPSKLKIAVSGCINSCTKPHTNDVGIVGVVKPKVVEEKCDGCERCVRLCKEAAIKMVGESVKIDYSRCLFCGDCIRVCSPEALVIDRKGYDVYIGGNVGRHPRLAQKILSFCNEEDVFNLIKGSIRFFESWGEKGMRLGMLIDRIGLGEYLEVNQYMDSIRVTKKEIYK